MGYLCGKRQALGRKKWNHACDIAFEVLSDHDGEHLEPKEILEALWQRWFDLQANPSETIEAVGLPFDSYLQSETVKEPPIESGGITMTLEEQHIIADKRKKMWDLMDKLHITNADIEFSGGGDDGGVDNMYLYEQHGKYKIGVMGTEQRFPTTSFMSDALRAAIKEEMHSVAHDLYMLEELLHGLVYEQYGSFAGDYHTTGQFHVDLETRTIK